MHKLTKIITPALIAIATLGSAGAATAQPYNNHNQNYGNHQTPGRANAIRAQIDDLQRRIERNDNRDRVSEREAAGLRREIRDIRDQFRVFSRDGLNNREFRTLEVRIDRLKARLRVERNDRDGRRW
jgi:predicted RNase H-like nuclease (RuvC/YqgF family)